MTARIRSFVSRSRLRNRGLLLAVGIALAIRLAFFVAAEPWNAEALASDILVADAAGYHKLGLQFKDSFSFDDFGALRTPAYPLYLAASYAVSGNAVWLALLLQAVVDVGTVAIVFFIAWSLFKRTNVAVLASILYAVSFVAASGSTRLGTDTLFAAVLALSVLVYIRAVQNKGRWRLFVLVGLLLGLASLLRPVGQYVPVLFVLGLIIHARGYRWKIASSAAMLAAFLIVISPWQVRNLVTFGQYSLSNNTGFVLFNWHAAMALANAEGITIEEARFRLGAQDILSISNPFERERVERSKALQYMRGHPVTYLRAHVRGIGYMFGGNAKDEIVYDLRRQDPPIARTLLANTESLSSRVIEELKASSREFFVLPILGVKLLLEYGGFVVGIIVLARRRELVIVVVLLGIMAYFSIATGVVGDMRFRLPIIPLYLSVSALGLFIAWDAGRRTIYAFTARRGHFRSAARSV